MKAPLYIYLSAIFFFFLTAEVYTQSGTDPSLSLPQEIDNWKAASQRTFSDSTLYDYIDGGAELFLSFGFEKVYNRIYSRQNQPDLLVDIFYMNTSYDSFGAFTHTSGKIGKEFGAQSQLTQGAIVFWKSNFYVSIFANPETEESKSVLPKLASSMDESIKGESVLPEVLNYLPENIIDRESIRYFRHYIWLNSYYPISNKNILNINQNTHAVLARAGLGEDVPVLLLIEYPSVKEVVEAKEKFVIEFDNGFINKSALLHNDRWAGCKIASKFFVGVFNCESKQAATDLMVLTIKNIESRQIDNK